MKTKIFLLVISVLYCGVCISQTTEKVIVNFATDSYVLDDAEQEKLLNVISKHKPGTIQSLTLKGHTDNVGTDDYNKTLSSNRTKTVSGFLQQNGIPSSTISTGFFGEQAPLETNTDEKGKAHNRRVEVELVFNEQKADLVPEKKSSAIQLPIPGLEKQFQYFTVNTSLPCTLTTASGAQVRIPAYAFADGNGNPVSGDIQIGFRDYYKPLEVFLSGIPMTYDSAGSAYHFETDGMFEVKAVLDQQELALMKNKNVEVDIPSASGGADFNFYNLEESGGWNHLGKATPANLVQREPTALELYLNYISTYNSADTTPFASRFPSLDYQYLRRKNTLGYDGYSIPGTEFKLKTAYRANGDKKDLMKFKVNDDKYYWNRSEMRGISNEVWVYDGDYNKHDFASAVLTISFQSKRFFNDMRLEKNKEGDGMIMVLKENDKFMRIPVHIYGEWDKKERAGKSKFRNREVLQHAREQKNEEFYKLYTKQLKKREKLFNRDIALAKKHAAANYEKMMRRAKQQLWDARSEEEKKMSREEWNAYVDDMSRKRELAIKNSDVVFRTVTLNNMGIFNCDRIGVLQNPVPIIAQWNDAEGHELASVRTYVLDKTLNGMMTFYNGNITLDPATTKAIIVVDGNGELAYSNEEALGLINFNINELISIPVIKLQGQPKSEEEFGKLLGLAGK